jgi:hypothetical protein
MLSPGIWKCKELGPNNDRRVVWVLGEFYFIFSSCFLQLIGFFTYMLPHAIPAYGEVRECRESFHSDQGEEYVT